MSLQQCCRKELKYTKATATCPTLRLRGKVLPAKAALGWVAAPEKGPQAARLWRVAATCRSAGQLLKELHGSAAHRCQLAQRRKL